MFFRESLLRGSISATIIKVWCLFSLGDESGTFAGPDHETGETETEEGHVASQGTILYGNRHFNITWEF